MTKQERVGISLYLINELLDKPQNLEDFAMRKYDICKRSIKDSPGKTFANLTDPDDIYRQALLNVTFYDIVKEDEADKFVYDLYETCKTLKIKSLAIEYADAFFDEGSKYHELASDYFSHSDEWNPHLYYIGRESWLEAWYEIKSPIRENENFRTLRNRLDRKIREVMFLTNDTDESRNPAERFCDYIFIGENEDMLHGDMFPVISPFRQLSMFFGDPESTPKNARRLCNKIYEDFLDEIIFGMMTDKIIDEVETSSIYEPFEKISLENVKIQEIHDQTPKKQHFNIFNINKTIRETEASGLIASLICCIYQELTLEQHKIILLDWLKSRERLHRQNNAVNHQEKLIFEKEIERLKKENERLTRLNEHQKKASDKEKKSGRNEKKLEYDLKTAREDNEKLEQENRILKEQLSRRKNENTENLPNIYEKLERENNILKQSLKKQNSGCLISKGVEEDLFHNEQYQLIMSILTSEFNNQVEGTRRYDILKAVVEANEYNGEVEKRIEDIKSILNGYTSMNSTVKKNLIKFGFDVEKGGSHYKMFYHGDRRYSSTISATSSETKSGLNNAMDIVRTIL